MNEMIERVAKAMHNKDFDFAVSDSGYHPGLHYFHEMARVAIEAMREPTQDMVQAGGDYLAGNYPAAEACFRKMIDAILKDDRE